ncbi:MULTISPECIES: hypothetical protein [Acinetobacter]|nr:hypothetical protein [Acinetobacter pecorum]
MPALASSLQKSEGEWSGFFASDLSQIGTGMGTPIQKTLCQYF